MATTNTSILTRIRPLDGYEFPLVWLWLTIGDEVDGVPLKPEDLQIRLQEGLRDVGLLQLGIETDSAGHRFWVNRPFIAVVRAAAKKTKFSGPTLPVQSIKDDQNPAVEVPYLFEFCPETRWLILATSHAIVDGRTLIDLFDLVRRAARGEYVGKYPLQMCEFGHRSNYVLDALNAADNPPVSWTRVKDGPIVPVVDPSPCSNEHYVLDYKHVREVCATHGVSIQALLMAVVTRTARKYNNFPVETPISVYSPTDTRSTRFATECLQKCSFFCNAGASFPQVVGQVSVVADVKHCAMRLTEALATPDACVQIIRFANCVDANTLVFHPEPKMPDFCTQHVAAASHLGKVTGGGKCPVIAVHMPGPTSKTRYPVIFDAYHTDEKLFLLLIHAEAIDPAYIAAIHSEIQEVFNVQEVQTI